MGMDVHGLKPKENKTLKDFPILKKYREMEFRKKLKELEDNPKIQEKYWKETEDFENANPGVYFRNNCWWWRPLWNFCYNVAPDLISDELHDNGHGNSGAGLDDKDAKLLGDYLFTAIEDGTVDKFKKWHEDQEKDEKYKYPFEVDNVKRFAEFCIESGGFEIC